MATDVVVVGAGAAGIGVALALNQATVDSLVILERYRVGASFRRWPKEMQFITPSFPGNAFGQVDLNAVHPRTSPALFLGREHPRGTEYARYLLRLAKHFRLPVRENEEVAAVQTANGFFVLTTLRHEYRARFLIWAAGEFPYPRTAPFPGAAYGLHNSRVRSWKAVNGDPVVVVGGFESGIDAACHLAALGRRVVVLDPRAPWRDAGESDPSLALSPFTRERLRRLRQMESFAAGKHLQFLAEPVLRIDAAEGAYRVKTPRRIISTTVRPILATGFEGSLTRIREFFEWDQEGGFPLLNAAADESTRTPGLFVCGPMVRHRTPNGLAILCFIYKFRMRFALVAAAIAQRLGHDPTPMLANYEAANMVLNDVASCCGPACAC